MDLDMEQGGPLYSTEIVRTGLIVGRKVAPS
jgi:hypothetical protein